MMGIPMLTFAVQNRRFTAVVRFFNEGEMYGVVRFTVTARDRRAAREQARKVAEGSCYNDERIPEREIKIELVEEH